MCRVHIQKKHDFVQLRKPNRLIRAQKELVEGLKTGKLKFRVLHRATPSPLSGYDNEETLRSDCPDDITDSHVYHDIDEDDVRINNEQKRAGQSTNTAAGATVPVPLSGDIVDLGANPMYSTGDTQQADNGDNTDEEDICGRCKKTTRQRVFRAVIIFIGVASSCWVSTAIILYVTDNKEEGLYLPPRSVTTVSFAWKVANHSTCTKLSATPVQLLDKGFVPSSMTSTISSPFLSTTRMIEDQGLDQKITTTLSEKTSTDASATDAPTDHLKVTSTTSSPGAQTTDHDGTTTALSEVIPTSTMFPRTTKMDETESSKKDKQIFSTTKESYSGHIYVDSDKIAFGGKGSGPGRFEKSSGVVVSADNEIFVTDSDNYRVQVFNVDGFHLRSFRTVVPNDNAKKMYPRDIAMDGKASLWIVGCIIYDLHTHAVGVVQYNRGDGMPMTNFKIEDYGSSTPGIAVNVHRNTIILAFTDEILIYRPDGLLNHKFRKAQGDSRSFVASDKDHIYVSEEDFVQVYDHSGVPLFKFDDGKPHVGTVGLRNPAGVLVDSFGHVIVANRGNGRVDMFTSQGDFVRTLVTILTPTGIAIGPRGLLVVTNIYDNTVTIFPPHTLFL
ncbi:uncharacterized protein LOC118413779 [Branchiostoma floridae]|uniref:Uncharacterized protein LOC118413779 n=1 Tax=Branchiostoma floridae TaxID=7739 RepID=A0A9J7MNF3_BRAFL|nr:uncharacterized protein LOC118413779 [Branchiostoma floridae]